MKSVEAQIPEIGFCDAFDRAMSSFSETYADQNARDYQALREAWPPAGSRSSQACNPKAQLIES
jgi:hypothetical protein